MKNNISKPNLIDICVRSWDVIRLLEDDNRTKFNKSVKRDLVTFITVMDKAENEAIAVLAHEKDRDSNEASLKIPPLEKDRPFDKNMVPEKKFQKCACCGMETTNYAQDYLDVKDERQIIVQKWKEEKEQFKKSQKDSSVPAPKKKNGQPHMKEPQLPTLPKILIICKAYTMKHQRGLSAYHCPNCVDRTCDICMNNCMFVCCTKEVHLLLPFICTLTFSYKFFCDYLAIL